jgi:hypothetical protein
VSWSDLVAAMIEDLRGGSPRAHSYWAQQLAFSPVAVHALALSLRAAPVSPADAEVIAAAVGFALQGLGELPEIAGRDQQALALLARRQARALAWGRRRTLRRLLGRLGVEVEQPAAGGTERFLRPYPLLGWRPDLRLAG